MTDDELAFHLVDVPEWEEEDEFSGGLADVPLLVEDEATAREMLRGVRVRLPERLGHRDLGPYAEKRSTPLGVDLGPDTEKFDYHLIEVPTTLIVPENRQIVRMRLVLDLTCGGEPDGVAVAYDLFPMTEFRQTAHDLGEASLDVSKALRFAVPLLAGAGGVPGLVAAAAAECIGLKLRLPLRWTSTTAVIQSSNRGLRTLDWYIRDSAIAAGFDGYAIVEVPKQSSLTVTGRMRIELRRALPGPLGRLLKARYESDYCSYTFDAATARAAAGS
jgi:hypothetical protein